MEDRSALNFWTIKLLRDNNHDCLSQNLQINFGAVASKLRQLPCRISDKKKTFRFCFIFSEKATAEGICTFPKPSAPWQTAHFLSCPHSCQGTQSSASRDRPCCLTCLLPSRLHLPFSQAPWHKGQSSACTSVTSPCCLADQHHPRQRNIIVFAGREQEQLPAAECPALSWNGAQPFHPLPCSRPPSQLPAFSPFNTHSFSTLPRSHEKFPARGLCSNGFLKKKKIPYSRQINSFFSL